MSLSETMADGASSDSEAYALKDAEDVITMLSAFNPHTINEDDKTRVRTLIAETAIAYLDASEVKIYDFMSKLEILSSPVIATRLKARKRLGFKVGLVDLATQATEEVLNALQDKGRTGYHMSCLSRSVSKYGKTFSGQEQNSANHSCCKHCTTPNLPGIPQREEECFQNCETLVCIPGDASLHFQNAQHAAQSWCCAWWESQMCPRV